MKKYGTLLGGFLVLVIAILAPSGVNAMETTPSVASETEKTQAKVYVVNQLTPSWLGQKAPQVYEGQTSIRCGVTDKEGKVREIILYKKGDMSLIGDLSSIAKLQIGVYVQAASGMLLGKWSPTQYLTDKVSLATLSYDVTKEVLEKYREGNDIIINVEWKYPDSSYSKELKFTFLVGTL
ncbi:hypothetical protein H0W26_02215 [Candidatus Dependentiae bacterium]|nr:hypothetical protein [Candidatus Dependentiae bacterium]